MSAYSRYRTVWSDIMSLDDALLAHLIHQTEQPAQGDFEQHQDKIHSYFRAGSFSIKLARTMYTACQFKQCILTPDIQANFESASPQGQIEPPIHEDQPAQEQAAEYVMILEHHESDQDDDF